MHISYNKLWKLLIDRNMKKMELKDAAKISAASIAKLGRGDNITTRRASENLRDAERPPGGHHGDRG